MGNIISLNALGQHLSMSNGLTTVFLSTLGLSGTYFAKSEDDKRIIIWLLEKDQSAVGCGTVGFDICEMPWDLADFDRSKQFLLAAVDGAKQKIGWERLDYRPNEELLFPCLDQFCYMISQMTPDMLDQAAIKAWLDESMETPDDPILCGYPCCPKHQVFLTVFGCHLCND